MASILSIVLDVLVLVGLGVMIFYSFRLSKSLAVFRAGREEFGQMIEELGQSIATAETAIHAMKNSADNSGKELQDIIDRARGLVDELSIMNDAGDSLAARLEKLAEQNRALVQGVQGLAGQDKNFADANVDYGESPMYSDTLKKAASVPKKAAMEDAGPSFFIQDREYDDDDDAFFDDPFEDDGDVAVQSKAEKDLLNALKKKKKS